ncbi:MAG TPA: putative lipopolysaccharide heptosyltransferase III [Burkholderiales bacterium]|nr:putative lipopolysaccharide heptosyltransferase III [Burkholderiales bacterium]
MRYGPADAIDVSGLRRALVIQLRHHGDVLLTSPVFTVLKHHAPALEIDALVYAETREMLDLHPAIARVHVVRRDWKEAGALARLAHEWRLFAALRERGYDLIVHLSEHPRGAWLARSLGARYAVAPNFSRKPRLWKKSFSHLFPLPPHARRHRVDINLDALRRIGIQPGEDERRLLLVPGEDAERSVEALLAGQRLAAREFIHFHPGSRWQFKCWPPERAAALVDTLIRRGERVVLTAAPDERELELIAEIRKRSSAPVSDFSGKLTLKELAALSARAKLFIGVDSAPMHIAAAMQTPVVALFGPSGELEWAPWRAPHRIVASGEHPCRPCGNDGCGGGKVSECLTRLPVEAALAAIDSLLVR